MDIALMIEGQEGVTWEQWVALGAACERHGVPALFRSDHYMNLDGLHPERGSLDAWGTICALAAVTSTVHLGTMVSPATFRHPSELARIVATADLISGGRVSLGLGAGWHEREHAAHGFDYHDSITERMDVMEEQLDVILGAWADGPYDFKGKHYELTQLDAQPKPAQDPHPPIILGGQAAPRGARLAALFADEYNTVFATPEQATERKAALDAAAERIKRTRPLPLSVMTLTIIGTDQADLDARIAAVCSAGEVGPEEFLKRANPAWIIGTVDQALERFEALAQAGVSRVMCQHLAHWDLDFAEILGRQIRPQLSGGGAG